MSKDVFEERRQGLEGEFFIHREQELIGRLRQTLAAKQTRAQLQQISGIDDDEVLDTLMSLHINGDTFAAFGLYPLVEIAWADGTVDEKEREAFLRAAAEHGLAVDTPGHDALLAFIKETPRADARKAWFAWAEAVNQKLTPLERRKVREGLVKRARAVAEASGGFLGLTNPVSDNEARVITRIEETFAD